MLRGELDFCLCSVCASARRQPPEQGDIGMGFSLHELFERATSPKRVAERRADAQLQGQAAAPSVLFTHPEGLLNAPLPPAWAHLGGGYGAVDDEADPVGPSVNVSVFASERTHRELVDVEDTEDDGSSSWILC